MKNFSKNQLQNFMQQLYKTDEVGSDRIELDETTLTADSQDNFMIFCILNFKNLGFYQAQETNAETEVETVPQLEAEPEADAQIEATEEPEAEAEIEAADEPEAEADPTEAEPAAEAEHKEEDKLLAHLQLNMITANNIIPCKVRQT